MRHDKAGSTICRDYLVGASSEARDCALWRTGRALPLRWYEENSRAIHRREMQGGRPIPPSCRGAWHAPEPGEHPFSRSQAGAWEREKRVDGLAGRSLLSYYAGKLSKDSSEMYRELIQSDPNIMMGKPVVAGTRITVESILDKLAAGETLEQILDAHPRLTREAIAAALAYAADVLRSDVVYPASDAPG